MIKWSLALSLLLSLKGFCYPSPHAEEFLVRRALSFWQEQEYASAQSQMAAYFEAFPRGPFTDTFHTLLGKLALKEERYNEALTHLKSSCAERWEALYRLERYQELYDQISPRDIAVDPNSKFYYAEASFHLKHLTEALQHFEKLEESPRFGLHALIARGEIFEQLGEKELAARLFLQAAQQSKKPESLSFHAATLLYESEPQKATTLFQQVARSSSPFAPHAATIWLKELANEKNWSAIAKERQLWLDTLEGSDWALASLYLGLIHFKSFDYLDALHDLSKALHQELPKSLEPVALRAMLRSAAELGDPESAEVSFSLLSERLLSETEESIYLLARSYQRAGLFERALHLFAKLDPSNEQAFLERISLHLEMSDWRSAKEEIDQFLDLHWESSKRKEILKLAVEVALQNPEELEPLASSLQRALLNGLCEEHAPLLAETYLLQGNYFAALGVLKEMRAPDPSLLAKCYIESGQPPEKWLAWAERAETIDLSLENQVIFARHLGKKRDQRAPALLDKLIAGGRRIGEEEIFSLAEICAELGKPHLVEKWVMLLEELGSEKTSSAALFLADAFSKSGEIERAQECYQRLEREADLRIAYTAKLMRARAMKDLKALQELGAQKTIEYEPIHLEAALDAAELAAAKVPEKKRSKELLKELLEVQEAFTERSDSWAKGYHSLREKLPEQNSVYQSYMRYLEARIALLEGDERGREVLKALVDSAVTPYLVEKAQEGVR